MSDVGPLGEPWHSGQEAAWRICAFCARLPTGAQRYAIIWREGPNAYTCEPCGTLYESARRATLEAMESP